MTTGQAWSDLRNSLAILRAQRACAGRGVLGDEIQRRMDRVSGAFWNATAPVVALHTDDIDAVNRARRVAAGG